MYFAKQGMNTLIHASRNYPVLICEHLYLLEREYNMIICYIIYIMYNINALNTIAYYTSPAQHFSAIIDRNNIFLTRSCVSRVCGTLPID